MRGTNKWYETCIIWVLGIQDICHFTSSDMRIYPFYFQGYENISILLPGISDTVFNILLTFRYIENLGKLIIGIFASLKGILAYLFQGILDIWYPLTSLWNGHHSSFSLLSLGLNPSCASRNKSRLLSRLLKCLRRLYGKQFGPRSDCSYILGPHYLLLYLICQ